MSGDIVTLLSADLVGHDPRTDPSDLDAPDDEYSRLLGLLRDAVIDGGGEEITSPDENVLAVFDSAVRAVECASGMQRAIEIEHQRSATHRFEVRVGLHVIESPGNDELAEAVELVQRLRDRAVGGQILATGPVRGLIASRGGFTFTAAPGTLDTTAFAVGWSATPTSSSGVVHPDPRVLRLVGRHHDLEALEGDLAESVTGRLGVVLLVGDAGVGKTRLTHELVARHHGDVIGLSARAYPLGATSSLGLWVEALERHLRTLPRSEVEELCGTQIDDLATLLPTVGAVRSTYAPIDAPRVRLLGGLAALLARMAERAPVVLVFDDVHLADNSSWEALNFLTRNLSESRLLVLLVARPVELADHQMASDVLLGLEQEGLLRRHDLTNLSAAEMRELAAVFIDRSAPDALVDWLMERSQGSPLFASGLLRALVDEGADLEHPDLASLPEDLTQRVSGRLQHLDSPSRALLEMLSVLGYRVQLEDLVRVSGRSLDELAPTLERLTRERLVSEEEQSREITYEVTHPLIQEAVYQSIGAARRRALHRHVARGLVVAGRLGDAAPHFARSSELGDDEAIDALCGALARAEAREHHSEALALLEALIDLIPAGDPRWLRILDVMPLQPEWVVDHRADARAETGAHVMGQIIDLLERSGDRSRLAAVKFNLGSLLAWGLGQITEGEALVSESAALFVEVADDRARLIASNELGYMRALGGDGTTHRQLATQVLIEARAVGDRLVILMALASLAWSFQVSGDLEAAEPIMDEALAIARQDGKLYRISYLLGQQAFSDALLGRGGEADRKLAQGRAANPAFRDSFLLDFLGWVRLLTGDLDEAVSSFRESLAWAGNLSRRRAYGAAAAVRALAEKGDFDGAMQLAALSTTAYDGRDWWVHSALPGWGEGVTGWLRGDGLPALATLHATAAYMAANDYWLFAGLVLADLAEAALDLDAPDLVAEARAWSLRHPQSSGSATQRATAALTQAAAHLSVGDDGPATTLLEHAAAAFASAGWVLHEGRSRALLGRALRSTDRGAARQSLELAIDVFDRSGATVRSDRARVTLGRLGSPTSRGRRAVTGPDSLTKREREVAQLASLGRTAREIGEQLYIGERTVETHLSNAYAKLGISSKIELVRIAPGLHL